jgi:predicted tellurium resistance membrane protein TerC
MTLDASRALVAIAFGVVFAVWAGGDYGTQYFAGYLVEKSLYLIYLSTGLALILAFIGVKLILHWAHTVWTSVPVIATEVSLAVIVVVLAVTTVASLVKSRRDPSARAHAGSLGHHETADAPR